MTTPTPTLPESAADVVPDEQSQLVMITCEACFGEGGWEVECCSGFGGCSCGGRPVPMGICRVCNGFGHYEEGTADLAANIESIRGFGFIGSGPAGGYFDVPVLNMPGRDDR